jgi:hypothetical protein
LFLLTSKPARPQRYCMRSLLCLVALLLLPNPAQPPPPSAQLLFSLFLLLFCAVLDRGGSTGPKRLFAFIFVYLLCASGSTGYTSGSTGRARFLAVFLPQQLYL